MAARCPGLEAPQGRTDPGGERCQVVRRTEQEAAGHQAASWRKVKGKLKGSKQTPQKAQLPGTASTGQSPPRGSQVALQCFSPRRSALHGEKDSRENSWTSGMGHGPR